MCLFIYTLDQNEVQAELENWKSSEIRRTEGNGEGRHLLCMHVQTYTDMISYNTIYDTAVNCMGLGV